MAMNIEKRVLEPPFKKGWLKRGERIIVGSGHEFQMGHDALPAKNIKEAIKKEVRQYLLSGDICKRYSTCIWFKGKRCDIKINIDKEKGIQVTYEIIKNA